MPDRSLFVLTDPAEGQDDAFNDWYDNQHIAEVLEIPGFTTAQRYRLIESSGIPGDNRLTHRYLATYTIEGNPQEAMRGMLARRENGTIAVPPFVLPNRRLGIYETL